MYMVAKSGNHVDGINDVAAEGAWVRGSEAHAADARDLADGGQQFSEGLLPCRVLIRIHVLAEQLNFCVAEIGHLAGFGEDRIRGAAALFAPSEGDDAIGGKLVAAFNYGDVSAMRISAGGK